VITPCNKWVLGDWNTEDGWSVLVPSYGKHMTDCKTNLTFRGPLIVIYSYNENQRHALTPQIYFWNRTLHVSDSFSVHHQEYSTVHTAIGIWHKGDADCFLASSQHHLYDITIAVCTVLHSWWWTEKLSET
jgi:hypothetical protein